MHRLLIFFSLCLSVQLQAAEPIEKPNFIIINIDDLGYADIGPFGGKNPTPNLDRMASEGRKLTSHYAAPVCSPSRTALMTGCYPKRALPIPGVLFPAAAVGLNPDEVTVAEVLKSVGYSTACIGKWHLGDQPEFLPTRQGFDFFYGLPYSNDMGPVPDGARSNFGEEPVLPKDTKHRQDETGIMGASQPPLPLLQDEKVIARVKQEEQAKLTGLYTEMAVSYIREHKDKPFFLYLPHTAMHFPLYPSESFRGKSGNGLYGDWVAEVDWSVGQVLDELRNLKLDSKTLVIFTSDNGGVPPRGASNAPLRGAKAQTYEGGIRVCTLAWWPGKIRAGSHTDNITSMMDIGPTFARLAGTSFPSDRRIDGVDITSDLMGEGTVKPARDLFYYFRGPEMEAVRSGPWKLHLKKKELYNLEQDIGEQNNVIEAQPEVVKNLTQLSEKMNDDLDVKAWGPGCRPLGRVADPLPLIDMSGRPRKGMADETVVFP